MKLTTVGSARFIGLKIKTWPEQPFGLVGWTGIVPVKAAPMATRMVRMVTTSLIDVKQVAKRICPNKIADILSPGAAVVIPVPNMMEDSAH